MQLFLQFRRGCHGLPIAAGRVDRANGVCLACRCTTCGAVGNERHMIFMYAVVASLRQQHADL